MCQYSADDGVGNDWHITHLGMLANSGAGMLVIEATHVERRGRITHGCLGLYSDACEAALERIVYHCHHIGSAKLAIQLAHAGRKASSQRPWEGAKALTAEDPELMSASDADKAHRQYVWIFHFTPGTFDPANFSPRRRYQFAKVESNALGSKAGLKTVEDAFRFVATANH